MIQIYGKGDTVSSSEYWDDRTTYNGLTQFLEYKDNDLAIKNLFNDGIELLSILESVNVDKFYAGGILKTSFRNEFDITSDEYVSIKIKNVTRYYSRLSPGIASYYGFAYINKPATELATLELKKIFDLKEDDDEFINIKFNYFNDSFKALIHKIVDGHMEIIEFTNGSDYDDDNEAGYNTGIELLHAIYNNSFFTEMLEDAIGDELTKIDLELTREVTDLNTEYHWILNENGLIDLIKSVNLPTLYFDINYFTTNATDLANGMVSFTNPHVYSLETEIISGDLILGGGTESYDKDSGALILTDGGLGVDGNINAGGDITVTGDLIGNVTGNVSGNTSTATKLNTARTIDITGDITAAAVAFDGTQNIAIVAAINNDSHTHETDYYNKTLSDVRYVEITGDIMSGNLVVQGNLTVSGTTVTVDAETVLIEDNIIVLNSNETSTPTKNAGLEIERGTSTNYQFIFNEGSDTFEIGMIGSLQPVATREPNPINTGVAYWDTTTDSFETNTGFTYNTTTNTLSSGNVSGNLTGNLTGDVSGDLIGDVTGDVTGDVSGNVTGDLIGNVTGNLTGNVTGNVTGNLTGDVSGDVTGNSGTVTDGVYTSRTISTISPITGGGDLTSNRTIEIPAATASVDGYMTSAYATKVDALDLMPIGTIIMFDANHVGGSSGGASGAWLENSTMPGWRSCIAENSIYGCPNLVDKFVMGKVIAGDGDTGGSNTHKISSAELPTHTHDINHDHNSFSTIDGAGNHRHSYTTGGGGLTGTAENSSSYDQNVANTNYAGAHNHIINIPALGITASGDGGFANTPVPNNNQPAYYSVIYIRKCS